MSKIELYGTASCPYTQELREWLEWKRREFVEYDVEVDEQALARMQEITGGQLTVPVLIEDGKVSQIGWQARLRCRERIFMMTLARSIRVRGVVQGVGFRPFVFRLARANSLAGWVLNEAGGVEIHLEGAEPALDAFVRELEVQPPPAARIAAIDVEPSQPLGLLEFSIRETQRSGGLSVRISPDLPVCEECLAEMRDPANPRYRYPYINCTNCGPRYTVIEALPYDRPNTTMKHWPLDALCAGEYNDPANRRFHAQPIACPECGPQYLESVEETARLLQRGSVVAVKGIGGYHLACDARNPVAVRAIRERKYRKEKPFAVMVRSIEVARRLAELSPDAEALLRSSARPIVLAPSEVELAEVAPGNSELGVMLPYAPLHHLLFDAGAPDVLVMTSANRSSEPIAYQDETARVQLAEIADAFLIGERPIARRVDDSVARAGAFGPVILRRSRGYAPGAVAKLPTSRSILALGADLKNTITLVVEGQAFVSQHIGDLQHFESRQAFHETIQDLMSMYEVDWGSVAVAHDLHPEYALTLHALGLAVHSRHAIQHHRAHIASVLAEKESWDQRVIGVSFDGTGYGDDGTIWGGEFFAGSMRTGFERVMHLRTAELAGGDAAAVYPVQCAAGVLAQMEGLPDLGFPTRYRLACELIRKHVRTFETTSMGRLFDAAAALLGFTREISFEGQAAMWLEQLARRASTCVAYPFPIDGDELDFRPLLAALIADRARGRDACEMARSFQRAIAVGLCDAAEELCEAHATDTIVLSGGVFQNELLLEDVRELLAHQRVRVWTNAAVPPNDGGISLGRRLWLRWLLKVIRVHELSIAMSILEAAEEEAAHHGGARVEAIHIKIGPLSGVVGESLMAAYELAREQTPFQDCRLVIEEVPIVVYCSKCEAERAVVSVQSLLCRMWHPGHRYPAGP